MRVNKKVFPGKAETERPAFQNSGDRSASPDFFWEADDLGLLPGILFYFTRMRRRNFSSGGAWVNKKGISGKGRTGDGPAFQKNRGCLNGSAFFWKAGRLGLLPRENLFYFTRNAQPNFFFGAWTSLDFMHSRFAVDHVLLRPAHVPASHGGLLHSNLSAFRRKCLFGLYSNVLGAHPKDQEQQNSTGWSIFHISHLLMFFVHCFNPHWQRRPDAGMKLVLNLPIPDGDGAMRVEA